MKLVLVISSLTTGGAERVLSILANSWSKKGWQVVLITTHDDGARPFYFLEKSVTHIPILLEDIPSKGHISNLKRVFSLRSIIKSERPDAIVSFLNYTNVLTLLASTFLNIPTIVSERLDPSVHRLPRTWNALRRILYPKADILVNQTEAAASWFRGWMGSKVFVLANPVSKPVFSDSPPEFVLPESSIVAMGRLHPQKGFDTLLKAMVKIRKVNPKVHLTILGDGPLREELEGLREKYDLNDFVSFPGRVKRPQDILKQAELFVLSSVTEGFPNVLCEAMAVGLPVVSTNCPSGPAEIIRSGHNGILIPVGDSEAIAEAVLQLFDDDAFRLKIGKNAKDISKQFSIEKIIGEWDVVFKNIGFSTGQ